MVLLVLAYAKSTSMSWIKAFLKVFQSGPEGWGTILINVFFIYGYDQEATIEMYENIVKNNRL